MVFAAPSTQGLKSVMHMNLSLPFWAWPSASALADVEAFQFVIYCMGEQSENAKHADIANAEDNSRV